MYACERCNREYQDWSGFNQHLRNAVQHSKCYRCRKGFASLDSYNQHLNNSTRHAAKTTVVSPKLTYESPRGYSGVPSDLVKPVWKAALHSRFKNVDTNAIIKMTGTKLDGEIVAAILEGALRLLQPDNTAEGQLLRKTKEANKAAHSAAAEEAFIEQVRSACTVVLSEVEQRQQISIAMDRGEQPIRLTPDALLVEPVCLAGSMCHWIEFKNSFGFKSNPFVHKRHVAQYKRYVNAFGPGLTVYKLGFECHLFEIEGVKCAREDQALLWLKHLQSELTTI